MESPIRNRREFKQKATKATKDGIELDLEKEGA
jgi:hypothetical protein